MRIRTSLPLVFAALLAATGAGAEDYVPPALCRVHLGAASGDGRTAPELARQLAEAGGDVVVRGADWLDVVVPSDRVEGGSFFAGLGRDLTIEVRERNLDARLARFREVPDAGAYHTYEEVEAVIRSLVEARPDLVHHEVVGTSWEGRSIHAVRISSGGEDLPAYMITGAHHAREWISVEVPVALMRWLVESYDTDPEAKALVDSRRIWVVPVVNPDGLVYSQTHYRMWRKNRRDNGDGEFGVDLNRNYGHVFGQAGSSDSTWSDVYHGPEAFSEPETRALRDLVARERCVGTLSFHSYGELVLFPWSYGYEESPDHAALAAMAAGIAAKNGYTAEKSSDLYPSSGDFDDWFYGDAGAVSFTIELANQFVPDEDEIPAIVGANLPAVAWFLKECKGFPGAGD